MTDYILYKTDMTPHRSFDGQGSYTLQLDYNNEVSGGSFEFIVEELARKGVTIDEKQDSVTTLPAPRNVHGRHDLINIPVSLSELVQFIKVYKANPKVFKKNPKV